MRPAEAEYLLGQAGDLLPVSCWLGRLHLSLGVHHPRIVLGRELPIGKAFFLRTIALLLYEIALIDTRATEHILILLLLRLLLSFGVVGSRQKSYVHWGALARY